MSAAQRRAVGLEHWVDGTIGVLRSAEATRVFVPNGAVTARHITAPDLSGLLAGLAEGHQVISGLDRSTDHASGGPVLFDGGSGLVLLCYHGEEFEDGNPERFRSHLGLAVSSNHGETFEDLGRVVTSDRAPGIGPEETCIDLGSGAMLEHGGWIYVYFMDRGIYDTRLRLAVARARATEVFSAAKRGSTPRFLKYHERSFSSPGVGGEATDLLPGSGHRPLWIDVARLEDVGSFLLVYSSAVLAPGGEVRWMHFGRVSHDGLCWSPEAPLYAEESADELLYLSIDSGGLVQRHIEGRRFDLYRTASSSANRWDSARLERISLTWENR